MIAICHYKLF